MKKLLLLLSFSTLGFSLATAQKKPVHVFVSGQEGYKSYRIPEIISLPNGDLLAFAEGRKHGAADYGDVDIVMKRSTDKGKTWSALQDIVDYETLQAGNAAPVVDLTDPKYPKGRIFLFYNTGNNHEYDVRMGKGLREAWYKTSTDNGKTWSEAVNITTQVHRPKQPETNPAYNFPEDWRALANTPGHAMQFTTGKYKGRIFVASNHSSGDAKNDATDYVAHGYFTDDHGKTFHLGNSISILGSNESTAAELGNGDLMMNSRNQKGDIRERIISISKDGGQTWEKSYFDKTLIDPVNEGSLLNIGTKNGKNILAFSNTADTKQRNFLTLRISEDDGKTWTKNFLIEGNKEAKDDVAAYSDLVKINKNTIGILYERDNYKEIVFTTVKWR